MSSHNQSHEAINYKFRAECEHDARLFLAALKNYLLGRQLIPLYDEVMMGGQTVHRRVPDTEAIFTVGPELSIGVLRWLASQLDDSHVIADTLQVETEYDGERLFGELEPLCQQPTRHQLLEFQDALLRYGEELEDAQDRVKDCLNVICNIGSINIRR